MSNTDTQPLTPPLTPPLSPSVSPSVSPRNHTPSATPVASTPRLKRTKESGNRGHFIIHNGRYWLRNPNGSRSDQPCTVMGDPVDYNNPQCLVEMSLANSIRRVHEFSSATPVSPQNIRQTKRARHNNNPLVLSPAANLPNSSRGRRGRRRTRGKRLAKSRSRAVSRKKQ